MLPFAIQLAHAFEKHEFSICHAENKIHFDSHTSNCAVFHYKINNNTVSFSSINSTTIDRIIEEKIYAAENQNSSVKLYFKSSRAPPFLLF